MLPLFLSIAGVIALGISSRSVKLNNPIWDHYLGDALYAVMFYLILWLFWPTGEIWQKGLVTLGLMLAIEFFQLTNIPLQLFNSDNPLFKIIGTLLGTKFEWLEILAYVVGIAVIAGIEWFLSTR